jgi:8-oxo-dGTP pyrophosphatase MutT (NUDIX family)
MTSDSETPITPASTVLLVRDIPNAFEVFMVTRHHKIDFASGALVFPGGKLDPQDSDAALLVTCDGQGLSDDALAVRICGIRETFEEAGVLLARDNVTGEILSGARCAELAHVYREALHGGDVSLLELIQKEDLTLACDQLTLFARWVTPAFFPRRFDAFFFLAEAPKDQIASHDDIESTDSVWTTPSGAIADADEGRKTVVFATRMNLQKLAQFDTTVSLVKGTTENEVVTVEPGIEDNDGDITYTIPIEAGYGISEYTEHGGTSLKIRGK